MQYAASGRNWFISRDGQQYGPVNDVEMAKLVELGHLSPVDYVWYEGMGNWAEARTVPELVAMRQPPPPPPPPPPAPPPRPAAADFAGGYGQPERYSPAAAESAALPAAGGLRGGYANAGSGATGGLQAGGVSAQPGPRTDDKTLALIAYVLLLLPIPPLPLIGVIIAFVNRGSAPAWLETHYRWQIRTFLIGLVYLFVGLLLSLVAIGFVVLLFTVVWHLVRMVKGIMALNRHEPIANPATWLW